MAKNFDIYDFVHNNKITLKVDGNKGTTVAKAYNDIRKTNLKEVKIVNGKFSLAENLEDRKLSNEVKKHFLVHFLKKDLFLQYRTSRNNSIIFWFFTIKERL